MILSLGCRKDYVEPDLFIPKVDTAAFENDTIIGIRTLRNMYINGGKDTLFMDTLNYVIKAVVVANDESGNLYKKIVIQDETAGIDLILDGSYMYNEYRVGQEVYVKCRGLIISNYESQLQLGYAKGYLSRIPAIMIPQFVLKNGLADESRVPEPIDVQLNDNLTQYASMLIRFPECQFIESEWNTEWCPAINSFTEKHFLGNTNIVIRTGSYANFAASKVPAGIGSITSIVTLYRNTYQLMLRDINDVGKFQMPETE